jgi:hypothetical protein
MRTLLKMSTRYSSNVDVFQSQSVLVNAQPNLEHDTTHI